MCEITGFQEETHKLDTSVKVGICFPFNLSAVYGATIEMLNNMLRSFQERTTANSLTQYLLSIDVMFCSFSMRNPIS